MSRPRVVIAGGGSGGHVFPGLAIADALTSGADLEVVFAGTARGLEASVVPARGYRLELLAVLPIKGGGPAKAARAVLVAAGATARSIALVRRLAPRVVLSVGGYAAGPVTLAAGILGVPVAVVEPNGVAGLANRILGPFARRAYVAWGAASTSFAPRKTRQFGVPLRAGFRPSAYVPGDPPRVLVLGGSQGAAALNERLPEALRVAMEHHPSVRVLHQTGKGRDAEVGAAYERAGVAAEVAPFLEDVVAEIARADVVVARAGACTVGEIAAIGRAAILVPFPFAADDHQAKNAEALAAAGGAIALRQSEAHASRLGRELAALLDHPDRRSRMAQASRAFGKPDAAVDIARDVALLAGVSWREAARPPLKTNGAAAPAGAA